MIKEPRQENFFAALNSENFSLEKLEDEAELQEILYFLEPSRANNVCEGIQDLEEAKQDRIIKNLTIMYPLSQFLLSEVLDKIFKSDDAFIEGFDIGKKFISKVEDVFELVQEKRGTITEQFDDYRNRVERLKKRKNDIEQETMQYEELKKQLRELEESVRRLEETNTKEALDKQIDDLRRKKSELEKEQKRKKREREELNTCIRNLTNSLKKSEKVSRFSGEQKEMLRKLLKTFPADQEDPKV